eukprot:Protomagalhaensia_sp_Gyna_25__1294@NODE_164_length_4703_cov_23_826973_g127_i0_p4_GENE_NODE_164_length_4703_cov_23_826973_g127_i0NODE_164_length_4703_cov_23_826973_g127_i0_p4_ORF_typecomplete_len263_score15_82_NODE_164_length_4703_cov_23_826973_g127_i039134608
MAELLITKPAPSYPQIAPCVHPRNIGQLKRICISRSPVYLMPLATKQVGSQSARVSKTGLDSMAIVDILEGHQLTRHTIDSSGTLCSSFLRKLDFSDVAETVWSGSESVPLVVTTVSPSGQTATHDRHMVSTARPSILRPAEGVECQEPFAEEGEAEKAGVDTNKLRLDEHEVQGRDILLKVSGTKRVMKSDVVALCNLKLSSITVPEVLRLLSAGPFDTWLFLQMRNPPL